MITNEKILSIIKDLEERRLHAALFSREDAAYAFCIRKLYGLIENKKPYHEIIPLQIKKKYRDFKIEKEAEIAKIREDF